jgi:MutS domain V
MSPYSELKALYLDKGKRLDGQFSKYSYFRIVVALAFLSLVYLSINTGTLLHGLAAVASLFGFLLMMRKHQQIARDRQLNQQLIIVNTEEMEYVNGSKIPFADGAILTDPKHLYAYDLDIFGPNSLYQHLNRTATFIGGRLLAQRLLSLLKNAEIIDNQEAIQDLTAKLDWRQRLLATAKLSQDKESEYRKLIEWSASAPSGFSKGLKVLCFVMPIMLFALLLAYVFLGKQLYLSLATYVFVSNLILTMLQVAKIKQEIIESDRIASIVKEYGHLFEQIEQQPFQCSKLQSLQAQLTTAEGTASIQIKRLAALFSSMDSIQNGMGAILFNGTILYHLHTLAALQKWKAKNASSISAWLDVLGEFETLSSLANFAYNNPDFCYPVLNERFEIAFSDLGHPLILREQRVGNDIDFTQHPFIILTGSNMSGKSTFLRTLGINMVLAGIGAPVCAATARVHPLPVIVSMRQTDSLVEQESYFFAEVKRLKRIIDQLSERRCFVLLDEILKGTNSDDKQTGTIEVIKKVISKSAIGAIATHDLEVCTTTNDYPTQLTNMCFEVEIVDDELSFDYKLRPGICKNKSATFLMKKMAII